MNAIGWSNGAISLVILAKEHPEALSSAIFVHGLASFSAEDGKRMQEKHPDIAKAYARFVVLERSGHLGPVEAPEAFRSAVFDFLGVTDTPR